MSASLPFLAPLALLLASFIAHNSPGVRPRRALTASRWAAVAALTVALASVLAEIHSGVFQSPLLGVAGLGLSVRLDAVSGALFVLVAFIGLIVVQFSRAYLDGDARQGAFFGNLCLTLASVMLLVLAGNLFQLLLGWVATSAALHRLLLFYSQRTAAQRAARKKYLTSRLSDIFLLGGAWLVGNAFGTADIGAILDQARALRLDGAAVPPAVVIGAFCLAVAALLKSAQFPAHGWLPEVMETPTPVSALLHAGIINAGGFLIIRFADVMMLSAGAMHLLALIGGFTALFGATVMLTQTSVKVSLAWSTVAQMGFMMLQCGLGVFYIAVLHIVAHSLYKAHAFLSSGSVIEIARASWVPTVQGPLKRVQVLTGLVCAVVIYAAVAWAFDRNPVDDPAVLTLGAILVLGLTQLIARGVDLHPSFDVLGRTLAAAFAATVAYFFLTGAAAALLFPALPAPPQPGPVGTALMILAFVSFALLSVLQIVMPGRARGPWWQRAYVHAANGFYVNALFDRLIGEIPKRGRA